MAVCLSFLTTRKTYRQVIENYKKDAIYYYDELYRNTLSYASIGSINLGEELSRLIDLNLIYGKKLCLFIPPNVCDACLIKELDSLSQFSGDSNILVIAPSYKKRMVIAALGSRQMASVVDYQSDSLNLPQLHLLENMIYFIYYEGKVDDVFIVSRVLQEEAAEYRFRHKN